jgi:hypothetical protein
MVKYFIIALSAIVTVGMTASSALSFGENVLAATGQYTFFIKPDPCAPITYYQKMVPCVAKEIVPVPRRVSQTYPVPVPAIRGMRTRITQSPVGLACGQDHCIECFPKPSTTMMSKDMVVPRMIPVRVPGVEIVPREVTRRVMLPQWFEVVEEQIPPKEVRKIQ